MNYKIIIDIIVLVILYFVFFYKKWKNNRTIIINTTMYFYIIGVLYFTLMPIITEIPFIFNHPYVSMNLNLFEDLFMHRGDYIRQIVLNIIMMIPFGFLLPICRKNSKISYVTCMTLIFSLCIEIIQPLIHGYSSSDITDIVTNTIGGFIGYIIYYLLKSTIKK